jgi:hypothetical protein
MAKNLCCGLGVYVCVGGRGGSYNLDVKCTPKVHVLKAWSPSHGVSKMAPSWYGGV